MIKMTIRRIGPGLHSRVTCGKNTANKSQMRPHTFLVHPIAPLAIRLRKSTAVTRHGNSSCISLDSALAYSTMCYQKFTGRTFASSYLVSGFFTRSPSPLPNSHPLTIPSCSTLRNSRNFVLSIESLMSPLCVTMSSQCRGCLSGTWHLFLTVDNGADNQKLRSRGQTTIKPLYQSIAVWTSLLTSQCHALKAMVPNLEPRTMLHVLCNHLKNSQSHSIYMTSSGTVTI